MFLTDGTAEKFITVEHPDFGQVAGVIADCHGIADITRHGRMLIAQSLEWMPSRRTVRGFACITSKRSSSSRLSGRRGRNPLLRHASSGVSSISLWTRE